MEEKEHIIGLLEETQKALKLDDSAKLRNLSDQTIHDASIYQHTDYIIIAILIYSLSKIVERKQHSEIKKWANTAKKINANISLAIIALQQDKQDKFLNYLQSAKKSLESISNLKPIIEEVIRKASINKASKIYEHGISLGNTAKLLGITQWELSEYIGQKENAYSKYASTLNIKNRAKMAMEFFSKNSSED